MVADLVREHIGLREIARRAELLAQLIVEREVDVNLLVDRAIERPGLGRCADAAGRLSVAPVNSTTFGTS